MCSSIRRAICAGALLSLFPAANFAATTVVPNAQAAALGNGQDNDTRLFSRSGDTDGNRYQQIYDAGQFASFGATEQINRLAFRAKQNGGLFPGVFGPTVTVSNIQIRLSTTARASSIDGANFISNVFADNIGPDLTTVYSGTLTLTTPTAGTTDFGYVINLQTPFAYSKATGNLLLDVLIPAGATTTESGFSGYSRPDTQTGDALGANANDGVASAFGATAGATIGANSTTGLVTQFATVPEPTSIGAIAIASMAAVRRTRRRKS
ncbi:MAG: PEP-CTERM sorting domain-containing protein [Anaerolineae bacterium]|nr:PEP-CTERM sorting domain-containing protein [Phycisphaerae bacterium]